MALDWGDKPAFCGNEAVLGLYQDGWPVCVTVDPAWLASWEGKDRPWMCTGSHHFNTGGVVEVVMCECECHTKVPANYVTRIKAGINRP